MTHLPDRVAVIGASVASAMLIERSRELGFAGEFIVVDSDPNAPYDRPPLSKQFLLGTGPVEPAEWWPEATPILNAKAIGLLTGLIEKAQARGEVRAGDPRLHAFSLMGPMVLGLLWRETLQPVGGDPVDLAKLAKQHGETILAGLLK